jgi:hypothetical protein
MGVALMRLMQGRQGSHLSLAVFPHSTGRFVCMHQNQTNDCYALHLPIRAKQPTNFASTGPLSQSLDPILKTMSTTTSKDPKLEQIEQREPKMEMPQNNQNDSLLLSKVPIEIRKTIFEQFFRSITMRHGLGTTSTTNTALLLTCHQIHSEASHLLALNISLHFRSTETTLDCLTTLPSGTIKSLCYIRVRAFSFLINSTTYQMAHTLPMFLGLQLDLFEVEDCYHDPGESNPWVTAGHTSMSDH